MMDLVHPSLLVVVDVMVDELDRPIHQVQQMPLGLGQPEFWPREALRVEDEHRTRQSHRMHPSRDLAWEEEQLRQQALWPLARLQQGTHLLSSMNYHERGFREIWELT